MKKELKSTVLRFISLNGLPVLIGESRPLPWYERRHWVRVDLDTVPHCVRVVGEHRLELRGDFLRNIVESGKKDRDRLIDWLILCVLEDNWSFSRLCIWKSDVPNLKECSTCGASDTPLRIALRETNCKKFEVFQHGVLCIWHKAVLKEKPRQFYKIIQLLQLLSLQNYARIFGRVMSVNGRSHTCVCACVSTVHACVRIQT